MHTPPPPLLVSRETIEKFKIFEHLLKEASQRLNLVSRETLPMIWERHLWDSYQLSLLMADKQASLIDLGTGAGFPGLVLAMAGYDNITLVEKSIKKSLFLQHVINALNLKVSVLNQRIEFINPQPYTYIVSRACAPLKLLLDFSLNFTDKKTQCIFLKGESWREEVKEAEKSYKFTYQPFPSLTHPASSILVIKGVQRAL